MIIKPVAPTSLFIATFLFVCFFIWSLRAVFLFDNILLYQENGVLENTQVLILIITFFVFLLTPLFQKRNDKLILIFFALLSLNFILREIDLEKFNIPSIFILLGSGSGLKIILAIGFFCIFFYAIVKVKYYVKLSIILLTSKVGTMLFMSALFLFAGGFFEEQEFHHHVYFEELMELIGYELFLSVSFFFLDNSLDEHGWVLR